MNKLFPLLCFATILLPFTALSETMTFVTGGMSPPLVYEENGKVIGTDVEVVKKFCDQNGIVPNFKAYPWKRALKYAQDGEACAVFSLFRTQDREQFLYYPSEPINSVKTVVIADKKKGFKISSIDDLKGKSLGVLAGYKYGPEFDDRTDLDKTVVNNKEQLLRLLANGKVDAILNSEAVFYFNCKQYGFDANLFETVHIIRENLIYVGFSKTALPEKGQTLAEKFDQFMKGLRESGELERIYQEYR